MSLTRREKWVEDALDELEAMGKKYDLGFGPALIGSRPIIQTLNDGSSGVVEFSMRLKDLLDEDDILGVEYRRKLFVKELSKWIGAHANASSEDIQRVISHRVNSFNKTKRDGSVEFAFKVVVAPEVMTEEAEMFDLAGRCARIAEHWIAAAIDFELEASTNTGSVQKNAAEPGILEKRFISVMVEDPDGDNLLDIGTRAAFFMKKVIVPDLVTLLDAGYSIGFTDPRLMPSDRYISYTHLDKTLNGVFQHIIQKNANRAFDAFRTKMYIFVEKRKTL